jgi:hypothetical protein
MRGGLPHQAGQPSSFTILFTPAREICGEKRSIFVLVSRGVGQRSGSCCRAPFIMHHLKADGIWSFHWPALCGVVVPIRKWKDCPRVEQNCRSPCERAGAEGGGRWSGVPSAPGAATTVLRLDALSIPTCLYGQQGRSSQ